MSSSATTSSADVTEVATPTKVKPPADLPDIRCLVFEGGGVKCLSYVGALEVLETYGIFGNVDRVAGASSGAIISLLLGLGYGYKELRESYEKVDFKDWMDFDRGRLTGWFAVFRNARRLKKEFGLCKGDAILAWCKARIKEKTGSADTTFGQLRELYLSAKGGKTDFVQQRGITVATALQFKEMYFTAHNIDSGKLETFSHLTTPNLTLAQAVRASMSFPFFFAAPTIEGRRYIDGGLIANYPLKTFDKQEFTRLGAGERFGKLEFLGQDTNHGTIGFRADTDQEIADFLGVETNYTKQHGAGNPAPLVKPETLHPIKHLCYHLRKCMTSSLTWYFTRVAYAVIVTQQAYMHQGEQFRTAYLSALGVRTLQFTLTETEQASVVASGIVGATSLLNRLIVQSSGKTPVPLLAGAKDTYQKLRKISSLTDAEKDVVEELGKIVKEHDDYVAKHFKLTK